MINVWGGYASHSERCCISTIIVIIGPTVLQLTLLTPRPLRISRRGRLRRGLYFFGVAVGLGVGVAVGVFTG
jgi:hypothetical protein